MLPLFYIESLRHVLIYTAKSKMNRDMAVIFRKECKQCMKEKKSGLLPVKKQIVQKGCTISTHWNADCLLNYQFSKLKYYIVNHKVNPGQL